MKWHTNHGSGCISYWSPTEVTDWSEQKRQHKEERDDIIEGDCPRHNKQIKKKKKTDKHKSTEQDQGCKWNMYCS